jgi:hypothetical protein
MTNLRRSMQPADGITVRQKSRAFFQRYRSGSDFRGVRVTSAHPSITDISGHCARSELGQQRKSPESFDHLVSERKQCGRHVETEFLSSLEVDHEFELYRACAGCVRVLFSPQPIGRSLSNSIPIHDNPDIEHLIDILRADVLLGFREECDSTTANDNQEGD